MTVADAACPPADSRRAAPQWRIFALATLLACILVASKAGLVGPAPSRPVIPVAGWIDLATGWFSTTFRDIFRGIAAGLNWPLGLLRSFFLWLPWPALPALGALLGYVSAGGRLALFCAAALTYIVVIGLWPATAVSLALVAVAVPLSAAIGLAVGLLAFRSRAAWAIVQPLLDLMQSIPTLAYLLPILTLFGIGPLVAVIASAVYAIPPMVRAVVHGLQRVPPEIVEAGLMSGSNRRQLLSWVLVPAATPTLLLGLNQTIMAGLSMVVIASMIGGASDIGMEVYQTMKQAKFGPSILAGFVIVLIAMVLDRVSRGFARERREAPSKPVLLVLVGVVVAGIGLAAVFPALHTYPRGWVLYPAPTLDAALQWFTVVAFPVTSALKTYVTYFVLLPFKIGLPAAIRPAIFGFEMSETVTYVYATAAVFVVLLLGRLAGLAAAAAFAVGALYYYFGTVGTPWTFTIALAASIGYLVGGWRIAVLSLAGLGFILLTGSWERAMISLELSAVGVAVSFLLGGAIGICAARSDRVSAVVEPVCDTLQTMPIFVFLIPAVMVFLVGEFTALVAIVLYAAVPAIRYTEHGIRSVPAEIVEAARMMGVTRRQMLWQVQLPVALPEIALGLNQTVILALAMVVVASLVGAPGLGQDVMVALSRAKAGEGLVAGLCIAILAIICDRMLQSWSDRRKRTLGL